MGGKKSSKSKSLKKSPLIQRHDRIGTGDAETDTELQEACFVDTGHLEILRDVSDSRCVILGRTGVGKTALIQQLTSLEGNVIEIAPEALSLKHISNSNIIKFFEDIGAHLDLFYKFLWLHVITVELLKKKYKIVNVAAKRDFLTRILHQLTSNEAKKKSLEYIEEWGDKFWEETEERVRHFTDTLETKLKAGLGDKASLIPSHSEGEINLAKEEKYEIIQLAKKVVDEVQLQKLSNLIKLLSEDIFTDNHNKFYVVIDGLDEDWAEDETRYRLVKALLEATRQFRKVRPLKIISGMRIDLLQKVISSTKTTGSQEEKYNSLYLDLRWSSSQLQQMLDCRVRHLFNKKQVKGVGLNELLPKNQVDRLSPLQYILDRTFLRPRETIQYINEALSLSDGKANFTVHALRDAEVGYSALRLKSLFDEWRTVYPNLSDYVRLIEGVKRTFSISCIDDEVVDDFVVRCLGEGDRERGPMYLPCEGYMANQTSKDDVKLSLLFHLYQTGVVGVKSKSYDKASWSYEDRTVLQCSQITEECSFQVHPTFWSALSIKTS